jgi:uncharacterized protein DUF6316
MFTPRNSEKTKPVPRHAQRIHRAYEVNGQWYFELRGGGQKGPYENELSMRADLNEFIRFHDQMNQQN